MEVVGNVSSSIATIHTTLSKIMTFKDEWFTLSDDYQLQVEILSSTLRTYQEQFRLHKQPTDSTAMRILKKAEDSLKKVVERLDGLEKFTNGDQCCSLFRLWYAKLNIALFPENMEKTVKDVEVDIQNIVKVLKGKTELIVQLQEERKRKAISKMAHINNGRLYVPIEKPQSAVIKAINDSQGHQIILLYGGAGKGKSTLAKWIYFTYGEARENAGNGEETEIENPFERMPILVSCAKCYKDDISAKQFQILQEHSPDILGDIKVKDKGSPDSRIAEALRDFLSLKKVLLILDDVTNVEFLHGMWASTSGDSRDVKYLVTSQDANICDVLGDPERIPMEKPTPDEARKILGSLVGLGPIIPDELQLTADKIIQAVEVNPLALACVASQFKHTENKKEIRAWSEAYKGLDKILKSKEEKFVLGSTPRSLGAAIESCISNLESPEAEKILFFMYACKGEIVHEAILRIWHASIEATSSPFFMLKDELNMKELILKPAVHLKEKDPNDEESTAWSLGPLAELFIKHWVDENGKRYEKDMRSIIGELVGEPVGDGELASKSSEAKGTEISQKARVTIVLCALYFDQNHVDAYEIVTKAMTRANIPYSSDKFNDLRRQAVEPVVWLLDKQEEDESWKGEDICCVQKVLLAYLCDGQLDGKNISHLLKLKACPAAQLATLKAISSICYTEEKFLFNEQNLHVLQAILDLMNSIEVLQPTSVQKASSRTLQPTRVQKASSRTFRAVSRNATRDMSSSLIVDAPGVLDCLVSSLARPSCWTAQDAAHALFSLAYTSLDTSRLKIIKKEGALESLTKCLFEHSKPDLQISVAGALINLSNTVDDSIKSRISNQAGALDGLVKLLFVDDQPKAQEKAALALGNLAATADNSIKSGICNQAGALDGLAKLLFVEDQPKLQKHAARALAILATTTDNSIESRISNHARALDGLVKLLFVDDQPEAQENAAVALRNLAASADNSIRSRISNQAGALDGLVKLLFVDDQPEAQENAALALANLASNLDNSINSRICNQAGALDGLVKLLFLDDQPKAQEYAALALANLAATADNTADDFIKSRISNQAGALDGLVKLLFLDDQPETQENAALALANLADAEANLSERASLTIAKKEGALAGIQKCLAARGHPVLQQQAGRVLWNLAQFDEASAILKGTEGLSKGLSSLLVDGIPPATQYHGVRGLTMIDHTLGKEASLTSAKAYEGRADAFIFMGMYADALADLYMLVDQRQTAPSILSKRCFVRAKLEDFKGALDDANEAVKVDDSNRPFLLQERGVLKQIMEDLEGALADLDEGLQLETDDYEILKHRGYVKFLLKDEEGARADAEWALRIKPTRVDSTTYGRNACLGTTSVEYLGYKLK